MARPLKTGMDWFPFEVHMNTEFQNMESIHGNDGFTWLIKFWQMAYQTEDGVVDLSDIRGVIASKTCRLSVDNQKEIIKTCLKLGLLKEIEPEKYTSDGIQHRLISKKKHREIDRNVSIKGVIDAKTPIIDILPPSISTQSRVDKSRVDKSRKRFKENTREFSIPTIQEVSEYCSHRRNGISAEKFHAYYTARGWMLGKTKMKNWKAAVITWEKSEYNNSNVPKVTTGQITDGFTTALYRNYAMEAEEKFQVEKEKNERNN